MGCKGSKVSEPEENVAGATLLQEPGAGCKAPAAVESATEKPTGERSQNTWVLAQLQDQNKGDHKVATKEGEAPAAQDQNAETVTKQPATDTTTKITKGTALPSLDSDKILRCVLKQYENVSADETSVSVPVLLAAVEQNAQHKVWAGGMRFTKSSLLDSPVRTWQASVNGDEYYLEHIWVIKAKDGQLEGATRFSDEDMAIVNDERLAPYQSGRSVLHWHSANERIGKLSASEVADALTIQSNHSCQISKGEELRVVIDLLKMPVNDIGGVYPAGYTTPASLT